MITANPPETTGRSKCFLCDEASDTVIWKEDGVDGLLCHCGMVYTDQSNYTSPADPIEEHHPDHFYSLPAAFKAQWVARRCPRGRLLEVGCGGGFFLSAVRSYGYDVVGLEPSHHYDQELQALNIPVVHGFVEENLFPKNSFDVVYHCDLLAHFSDPVRSLSAMCELLTPDGVLCFEVGLLGGVSSVWYQLVGRIGLGPHLWLYSDQAFHKLMDKAGLRILDMQYFGLAPQVVGGKALGVFSSRVVSPFLQAVTNDGKMRASRFQHSSVNFLRYRVGSLVPHVGPQTLMVVAKPATND